MRVLNDAAARCGIEQNGMPVKYKHELDGQLQLVDMVRDRAVGIIQSTGGELSGSTVDMFKADAINTLNNQKSALGMRLNRNIV